MVTTFAAAPHRSVRIVDGARELGPWHERRAVPPTVVRAIGDVTMLGWQDMVDRESVIFLADSLGHRDAAAWLASNRHLYFIALRQAEAAA
jgi:hypothetical protein